MKERLAAPLSFRATRRESVGDRFAMRSSALTAHAGASMVPSVGLPLPLSMRLRGQEELGKAEMTSNAELMERLFARGAIDLRRGESLDRCPPPLPATLDWDRIDGMMLGLAIGDALDPAAEEGAVEQREGVRARGGGEAEEEEGERAHPSPQSNNRTQGCQP